MWLGVVTLLVFPQEMRARLFDDADLRARAFTHGSLTVLKRHPAFDALMMDTVEQGLQLRDALEAR